MGGAGGRGRGTLAELLKVDCTENWGGARGAARVSAQLLASPQPESHLGRNKGLDGKPVRSIPSLMQQDMCGLAFIQPTFTHTHTHTRAHTQPLQWQTHGAHRLWL